MQPNLYEEAISPTTSPEKLSVLVAENPQLSSVVAANPSAPPSLLAELAKKNDSDLRKTLVRNPNTPLETLFTLGKLFPREFLLNPALELLFLEDPAFGERIPNDTLVEVVLLPTVPEFLVQIALRKARVRALLASNPKTNALLLGRIGKALFRNGSKDEWDTVSALTKNPKTPPKYLKLHSIYEKYYQNNLARNPNTPLSTLEKLLLSQDPGVRYGLTENPNVSVGIISRLLADRSGEVRKKAVLHPNAPDKILRLLYRAGASFDLRERIEAQTSLTTDEIRELTSLGHFAFILALSHPSAPVGLLDAMSRRVDVDIRTAVAQNMSCPQDTLRKLSTDFWLWAREAVAGNKNTPADILTKLCKDPEPVVRWAVARNTSATNYHLHILQTDSDPKVCSTAKSRLYGV